MESDFGAGPAKRSKREREGREKIPKLAHILMTREDTTHADYDQLINRLK